MKNLIWAILYKIKKLKKWYCPRCGNRVSMFKCVSPGYYGACLVCDEDFYSFELNTKPR